MEMNAESILLYGNVTDDSIVKIIFNCASEGLNIWCIIPNAINKLANDVDIPHVEALKLITFMYIKDHQALVKHINTVHVTKNCPRIILVANIGTYINLNDIRCEQFNSFIIASLLDAVQCCSNIYKKKCILMLMCESEYVNNMLQNVVQIYISNLIQIEKGNDKFILEINNILSSYL